MVSSGVGREWRWITRCKEEHERGEERKEEDERKGEGVVAVAVVYLKV
jgi:hypothetical protein